VRSTDLEVIKLRGSWTFPKVDWSTKVPSPSSKLTFNKAASEMDFICLNSDDSPLTFGELSITAKSRIIIKSERTGNYQPFLSDKLIHLHCNLCVSGYIE